MRTAPQAIAVAKKATRNTPGYCQSWTRNLYLAPSAGDLDHDGDADAADGWKSEPVAARFTDRKPMIGSPGFWSGGSAGHGHRAICVGYNSAGEALFRSTDAGTRGRGYVGTRTLSWFEKTWGLKWVGWSKTITGKKITGLVAAPKPPAPAKPVMTRGVHVDAAIAELVAGKKLCTVGSDKEKQYSSAIYQLRTIFKPYPKS